MKLALIRLVVIGAPLVLGLVEVWHFESLPFDSEGNLGPFTRYRVLAPVIDQWLIIHLVQVPLLALVGLGVYLIVRELNSIAAIVARVSMVVFVVFYTVLDAVAGIAIGVLVRDTKELSVSQQNAIEGAIESLWNNPIVGNVSLFSWTGALAWMIGVISAAIGLRLAGAPRGPVALMILAALIFGMSHASPNGPIGMSCLVAAFIWLEFFPDSTRMSAPNQKSDQSGQKEHITNISTDTASPTKEMSTRKGRRNRRRK